jgi:hypothetical protein
MVEYDEAHEELAEFPYSCNNCKRKRSKNFDSSEYKNLPDRTQHPVQNQLSHNVLVID